MSNYRDDEERKKTENTTENIVQQIPITKKGANYIIDHAQHITLRLNNHTLIPSKKENAETKTENNNMRNSGPVTVTLRKLNKPIQLPEGYMQYQIVNGNSNSTLQKTFTNASTQTELPELLNI